jgi:hypothetical protein
MEKRIINWRAEMMKPVTAGTYMIVGGGDSAAPQLYIVTRVADDGWVYGIESIDEKEDA